MEQTSIPGVDREVFERVWRRVMPEERGDCPFTLAEQEEPAAGALPALAVPAAPQVVTLGQADEGLIFPALALLPPPTVPLCQGYIDDELADWRRYQALAAAPPAAAGGCWRQWLLTSAATQRS